MQFEILEETQVDNYLASVTIWWPLYKAQPPSSAPQKSPRKRSTGPFAGIDQGFDNSDESETSSLCR